MIIIITLESSQIRPIGKLGFWQLGVSRHQESGDSNPQGHSRSDGSEC